RPNMREFVPSKHRVVLATRLGVAICAAFLLAAFMAPRASMQEGSSTAAQVERFSDRVDPASAKNDPRLAAAAQPAMSAPAPLAPEVAGNYVFTTATNASLTDMSVGTTQLLAAN